MCKKFMDEFNIGGIVKLIRVKDMVLRKELSMRYWDAVSQYAVGNTRGMSEAVVDFLEYEYEEKKPGYSLCTLLDDCMNVFYTFRLNSVHSLRLQDGVWFKLNSRHASMIAYLLTGCEIVTFNSPNEYLLKYPSVDNRTKEGTYESYLDSLQDSLFDWIAYYYTEHPIKCKDGEVLYTNGNLDDLLQWSDCFSFWSAYFSHCGVVLLKWLVSMGTNQDKQSNLHAIRVPYNACDRFAVVHFMHEVKDQLGLRVFDSATSSSFWADAVSVYEKAFPDVTFPESLDEVCFSKELLCLDRNKSCTDLDLSDCGISNKDSFSRNSLHLDRNKSCIDLDLSDCGVNNDFLYLVSKDVEPSIQRGFNSLVETACLREL